MIKRRLYLTLQKRMLSEESSFQRHPDFVVGDPHRKVKFSHGNFRWKWNGCGRYSGFTVNQDIIEPENCKGNDWSSNKFTIMIQVKMRV